MENELFAHADCLTATGSDETLATIRARLPMKICFLGYGQRVSFGFVAREVLVELPQIIQGGSYMDPKSRLQEIIQEKRGVTPTYNVVSETGPDHNKVFVVGAYIGDQEVGQGTGPSKQEAELAAAENSLKQNNF